MPLNLNIAYAVVSYIEVSAGVDANNLVLLDEWIQLLDVAINEGKPVAVTVQSHAELFELVNQASIRSLYYSLAKEIPNKLPFFSLDELITPEIWASVYRRFQTALLQKITKDPANWLDHVVQLMEKAIISEGSQLNGSGYRLSLEIDLQMLIEPIIILAKAMHQDYLNFIKEYLTFVQDHVIQLKAVTLYNSLHAKAINYQHKSYRQDILSQGQFPFRFFRIPSRTDAELMKQIATLHEGKHQKHVPIEFREELKQWQRWLNSNFDPIKLTNVAVHESSEEKHALQIPKR